MNAKSTEGATATSVRRAHSVLASLDASVAFLGDSVRSRGGAVPKKLDVIGILPLK